MDGISDQGLNGSRASSAPAHVTLARYVVQWDVMGGAGYPAELLNLRAWYTHAVALGLTPDVALDNYNCDGCSAPQTPAQYTQALRALLSAFPDIKIVEAWNEPNDSHYSSYLDPALAAELTNAAYAFCHESGCTMVAGDLLDAEANMIEYERRYELHLSPHDPGNWGIHPYHAVKYMSAATVASFREALPDPTADAIWFTEVGAYYCEAGTTYGEDAQGQQARFLVDTLMPEFQPAHVFYYETAWRYDEPPPCGAGQADTALYAATRGDGPLLARLAAGVVFGAPTRATASAASAAATLLTPSTAPLTPSHFACEPGLGDQWQRGECPYLRELLAA